MADLANVAFLITSIGGSISGIIAALARFREHDDHGYDDDYDEFRARQLERRADKIRKRKHRRDDDDDDDNLPDTPMLFRRWRLA